MQKKDELLCLQRRAVFVSRSPQPPSTKPELILYIMFWEVLRWEIEGISETGEPTSLSTDFQLC